ncbi:MAG: 3'-5' exonuclease [Proteobacteria bacterium]|nr:3'-5' exonuclease [Pseudomonadota bacterium]
MSSLDKLKHSMFYQVLFPPEDQTQSRHFTLRKTYRYQIQPEESIRSATWVVFDLETTGFHKHSDRIIEVGATKYRGQKEIESFSSLVYTDVAIPPTVQSLTGIDPSMLVGKPTMTEVLPQFLEFIQGSLLVCHNSAFDMNMLGAELQRQNIVVDYSCLCTLKMARDLLSHLANKKLVTIAEYFGFSYTTQHRSLEDARVTGQVFQKMLDDAPHLQKWKHMSLYAHTAS